MNDTVAPEAPATTPEKPPKFNIELRRPYTPFGAARQLWGCRDEEILMEGPAGTGKSRSVLEKINLQMMKYPGARALIVRKTRESMTESVLVTFEMKVVPPKSPILEGPTRKLRQNYRYPNGSEIVICGMDNPAKIMSTEYDVVGVFEGTEVSEEEYEMLTTRLRNGIMPYQQIIVDVNPGPPSHWLNKRATAGKMTRLLSRHRDNPVYFDQKKLDWTDAGIKYLKKLERLSGVRRLRLLDGKWAASEGMVYDIFDERVHIIQKMPAGWESWRKVRAVDFGFNNPFVCLWGAMDPDGDIYVYREIYMSGRIVSDHASGVRDADKILVKPGIKQLSVDDDIEATVADHDREDRETLAREGIDSIPAYKDIPTGIEAVYDRLRDSMHADGVKRPRLYFLQDMLVEVDDELVDSGSPVSTLGEFGGYVRAPAKPGKTAKEEPVDKDNHGMDALRYLIAYFDDLAGMTFTIQAEAPEAVKA